MDDRHKPRRALSWLRRFAAVLSVAIGLTAWLYYSQAQWNARYWRQQFAEAPDDELPALARRIVARQAEGIGVLVEGLGSPRQSVRREVRLALDDEVNRWARLPQKEASLRLGWLTAALAAEIERLDPDSRAFAADLATRILLWPTDGSAVDRGRLVAECEQVLRAGRDSDDWRRERDLAQASRAAVERWTSPLPVASHEPLPPASLEAPALPPLAAIDVQGGVRLMASVEAPRRLQPDANAAKLSSANARRSPRRNPLQAAANQAARTEDGAAERADYSQPLDGAGKSGFVETASAASESGISRRDVSELFAELTSSHVATASAAEGELTRRGYTHRQIEVGKHLASADSEERRRWTEALPGMRGIDAKHWLLVLSRDSSAEVRRAAVTLMATSQDPQMLARVQEVANSDSDPALREQAARACGEKK
ncbi:MAG TPA: HEAT repeat domain-containing protein [Pirellulales bacterium]|nr:HEAT repeat domain-containing protein [Pirellulales bacterium]